MTERPVDVTPPPPPPVTSTGRVVHGDPTWVRSGQLTASWQIMLAIVWAAAFFALAAVWKTSVEIGIGTWWTGPRSSPRPVPVRVVPFVITLVGLLLAVFNVRRAALGGIVAAVLLGAVAVFDVSRSGGLAAIEFAVAAATLLASVGALSGTYRPAHTR